MTMKWSVILFFLYEGFPVAPAAEEEYHEELTQSLCNHFFGGKLSAHFRFPPCVVVTQ